MPLTTSIELNSGLQSAVATFLYPDDVAVDSITFANNTFTYGSTPGFNLGLSDLILYCEGINQFNQFLSSVIGAFSTNLNVAWPVCSFNISEIFQGVTHLTYTQTSQGSNVYTINYVPVATAASFASRGTVTTTTQEWLMCVNMQNVFIQQAQLV